MTMGIFVRSRNSDWDTVIGLSALPPSVIGGGTSPSGKGKSKPGSKETLARTFLFLMAERQPSPPLCECVTRMPGPILLNSVETASVFTCASYGPVLGTICRKYWLSASGSRGHGRRRKSERRATYGLLYRCRQA